jgi:hypothetical protein
LNSLGETEEWGRLMAEDMLQVVHRHVIFTIDEGLRMIFLRHREMLKPFIDEAVKLLHERFKREFKVVPGVIAGLHTFGSRINCKPHTHMLVIIGGMGRNVAGILRGSIWPGL